MKEYSQYIKSNFIHHEPRELLPMPVSILLGVSAKAGESLKSLQIFSVFDLATSHIFANAKKIVEVARSTNTTFGRYGGVPADVVDNDGHYLDVTELHLQPVELLEGVGPHNGPVLVDALQVQTIRDLALWPPYVAAFNIVTSILTPEDTPEFDPEAPPDLIPKSGEFPTEKVFYSTVVIDEIEGQDTVELSGQVDIAAIGAGDVGFTKPATGAIITMEQAWYAQGVALGNLLHSVALAPGESTKIAMVDWSRQTSASTDEDTSQVEALSSGSTHNRSISEVTNAVATEAQGGFSNTTSVGTSASTGMALGGLPPGPSPLLVGASQSGSVNASTATTVSASAGRRDLMASMNQNVADRTQQHANSARTRRASVVQEVSQKESETLTTRTVTNYNHMHALSIQYYEVVQIYRTTTRVNSVEKCLFIPMKPVDFSNMNSIDRFREILSAYAFTDKARLALDTKIQLVEIERLLLQPTLKEKNDEQLLIEAARSATGSHVAPDTSHTSPLLSWQLHKEVLLHRIEGGKLAWKRIFVTRIGKSDMVWERQQDGDKVDITLDTLVPLAEIDSIYIEYYGNVAVKSSVWILTLDFEGRKFQHKSFTKPKTEDYVQVEEGYTLDLFRFNYSGYTLSDWLLKHLDQNRLYYSQAIWMNMGSATLSILLSQYTYNEKPLLQQIDPIPVAMTGNYVGFRMNADPTEDGDWRNWLVEHGYYEENGETPKNTAVHETVPLPSGGVFAEAVLGRFNAAEKLDPTRFWNWQDSPIPFAAPEIAALQAGNKAQVINQDTSELESALVQQTTPTNLPDPQGMAAIINALTTSNMFRDMSGMAQSAALAQAAMQAASSAATAAGNQAGANMATAGQFGVEMAKAIMPLLTMAAGAALGVPTLPGGGSPGKTNISNLGAMLNQGKKFDELAKKARASGAGSPGNDGVIGSPGSSKNNDPNQSLARDAFRSGIGGSQFALFPDPATLMFDPEPGWGNNSPATNQIQSNKTLVVFIENTGDLSQLFAHIPDVPEKVRTYLEDQADYWIEEIEKWHLFDNAVGDHYGQVIFLEDESATEAKFKDTMIHLAKEGNLIDVITIGHGGVNSLQGYQNDSTNTHEAITNNTLIDLLTEYGETMPIRMVYMMNCQGSSLNKPWVDLGALSVAGSVGDNFMPEPWLHYLWKNWINGMPFRKAVKQGYDDSKGIWAAAYRAIYALGIEVKSGASPEQLIIDSAPKFAGSNQSVTISWEQLPASNVNPSDVMSI